MAEKVLAPYLFDGRVREDDESEVEKLANIGIRYYESLVPQVGPEERERMRTRMRELRRHKEQAMVQGGLLNTAYKGSDGLWEIMRDVYKESYTRGKTDYNAADAYFALKDFTSSERFKVRKTRGQGAVEGYDDTLSHKRRAGEETQGYARKQFLEAQRVAKERPELFAPGSQRRQSMERLGRIAGHTAGGQELASVEKPLDMAELGTYAGLRGVSTFADVGNLAGKLTGAQMGQPDPWFGESTPKSPGEFFNRVGVQQAMALPRAAARIGGIEEAPQGIGGTLQAAGQVGWGMLSSPVKSVQVLAEEMSRPLQSAQQYLSTELEPRTAGWTESTAIGMPAELGAGIGAYAGPGKVVAKGMGMLGKGVSKLAPKLPGAIQRAMLPKAGHAALAEGGMMKGIQAAQEAANAPAALQRGLISHFYKPQFALAELEGATRMAPLLGHAASTGLGFGALELGAAYQSGGMPAAQETLHHLLPHAPTTPYDPQHPILSRAQRYTEAAGDFAKLAAFPIAFGRLGARVKYVNARRTGGKQAAREAKAADPLKPRLKKRGGAGDAFTGITDKISDIARRAAGTADEAPPVDMFSEVPQRIQLGQHVPDLEVPWPIPVEKRYQFVKATLPGKPGREIMVPQSFEAREIKRYIEEGVRPTRGEGEQGREMIDLDDPRARAGSIKRAQMEGATDQEIFFGVAAEQMELYLRGEKSRVLEDMRSGKLPKYSTDLHPDTIDMIRSMVKGNPAEGSTQFARQYWYYLNHSDWLVAQRRAGTAADLGLAEGDPRIRFSKEMAKGLPADLATMDAESVKVLHDEAVKKYNRAKGKKNAKPETLKRWEDDIKLLQELYEEKAQAQVPKDIAVTDELTTDETPPTGTPPSAPPSAPPPASTLPAGKTEQRTRPRPQANENEYNQALSQTAGELEEAAWRGYRENAETATEETLAMAEGPFTIKDAAAGIYGRETPVDLTELSSAARDALSKAGITGATASLKDVVGVLTGVRAEADTVFNKSQRPKRELIKGTVDGKTREMDAYEAEEFLKPYTAEKRKELGKKSLDAINEISKFVRAWQDFSDVTGEEIPRRVTKPQLGAEVDKLMGLEVSKSAIEEATVRVSNYSPKMQRLESAREPSTPAEQKARLDKIKQAKRVASPNYDELEFNAIATAAKDRGDLEFLAILREAINEQLAPTQSSALDGGKIRGAKLSTAPSYPEGDYPRTMVIQQQDGTFGLLDLNSVRFNAKGELASEPRFIAEGFESRDAASRARPRERLSVEGRPQEARDEADISPARLLRQKLLSLDDLIPVPEYHSLEAQKLRGKALEREPREGERSAVPTTMQEFFNRIAEIASSEKRKVEPGIAPPERGPGKEPVRGVPDVVESVRAAMPKPVSSAFNSVILGELELPAFRRRLVQLHNEGIVDAPTLEMLAKTVGLDVSDALRLYDEGVISDAAVQHTLRFAYQDNLATAYKEAQILSGLENKAAQRKLAEPTKEKQQAAANLRSRMRAMLSRVSERFKKKVKIENVRDTLDVALDERGDVVAYIDKVPYETLAAHKGEVIRPKHVRRVLSREQVTPELRTPDVTAGPQFRVEIAGSSEPGKLFPTKRSAHAYVQRYFDRAISAADVQKIVNVINMRTRGMSADARRIAENMMRYLQTMADAEIDYANAKAQRVSAGEPAMGAKSALELARTGTPGGPMQRASRMDQYMELRGRRDLIDVLMDVDTWHKPGREMTAVPGYYKDHKGNTRPQPEMTAAAMPGARVQVDAGDGVKTINVPADFNITKVDGKWGYDGLRFVFDGKEYTHDQILNFTHTIEQLGMSPDAVELLLHNLRKADRTDPAPWIQMREETVGRLTNEQLAALSTFTRKRTDESGRPTLVFKDWVTQIEGRGGQEFNTRAAGSKEFTNKNLQWLIWREQRGRASGKLKQEVGLPEMVKREKLSPAQEKLRSQFIEGEGELGTMLGNYAVEPKSIPSTKRVHTTEELARNMRGWVKDLLSAFNKTKVKGELAASRPAMRIVQKVINDIQKLSDEELIDMSEAGKRGGPSSAHDRFYLDKGIKNQIEQAFSKTKGDEPPFILALSELGSIVRALQLYRKDGDWNAVADKYFKSGIETTAGVKQFGGKVLKGVTSAEEKAAIEAAGAVPSSAVSQKYATDAYKEALAEEQSSEGMLQTSQLPTAETSARPRDTRGMRFIPEAIDKVEQVLQRSKTEPDLVQTDLEGKINDPVVTDILALIKAGIENKYTDEMAMQMDNLLDKLIRKVPNLKKAGQVYNPKKGLGAPNVMQYLVGRPPNIEALKGARVPGTETARTRGFDPAAGESIPAGTLGFLTSKLNRMMAKLQEDFETSSTRAVELAKGKSPEEKRRIMQRTRQNRINIQNQRNAITKINKTLTEIQTKLRIQYTEAEREAKRTLRVGEVQQYVAASKARTEGEMGLQEQVQMDLAEAVLAIEDLLGSKGERTFVHPRLLAYAKAVGRLEGAEQYVPTELEFKAARAERKKLGIKDVPPVTEPPVKPDGTPVRMHTTDTLRIGNTINPNTKQRWSKELIVARRAGEAEAEPFTQAQFVRALREGVDFDDIQIQGMSAAKATKSEWGKIASIGDVYDLYIARQEYYKRQQQIMLRAAKMDKYIPPERD